MKKTAAIVVCMHKILRIVYGMLKNKEKFNPEKDRANSTKGIRKNVINSSCCLLIQMLHYQADSIEKGNSLRCPKMK
jgi:hypothetical protein